jgi:hypothetical protein
VKPISWILLGAAAMGLAHAAIDLAQIYAARVPRQCAEYADVEPYPEPQKNLVLSSGIGVRVITKDTDTSQTNPCEGKVDTELVHWIPVGPSCKGFIWSGSLGVLRDPIGFNPYNPERPRD